MKRLPVDRGYPVPWFVAWLGSDGEPLPRGEGTPDFRVLAAGAFVEAVKLNRCWVCGQPLGAYKAFVIGPMSAVNRTSAEPPSHVDCADFAARACPFLARPHARRRELAPEIGKAPGFHLKPNPGVALVWVTKRYAIRKSPRGPLFNVGEPEEVRWYAEGRPASREEIFASIETGLPALREIAEREGPSSVNALERDVERVLRLVPQEVA
jgi:hypothetical protein